MEPTAKPPEAPKPKNRTMVLAVIIVVILVVVGVGVYILMRPSSSGPTIGEKITIWDTNGACLQSASPADCGYKDSSGNSNVTITVGTTVQWTNTSPSLPHTVTTCDSSHYSTYHSSGACPNGQNSASVSSFDSGDISQNGGTYQYTFNTAGTYYYFCTVHPWMNGEIIVH
jgi:plastocyanin